MQISFKAVIEDSSRNKFMFYYSGSSVCCKEVSKDGLSRDTMVASQVSEHFLAAIDLQDNLYIVCLNNEKGLYIYTYLNGKWKLDQILNIQGEANINLLSFFVHNSSIHIIYAKQMAIANFYNVNHLYKPGSPNSFHVNTSWRKNNVGEIYSENLNTAYSAVITKEGAIHMVNEWSDGNKYSINYSCYDLINDTWKKKPITSLFKKNIIVNILYEENTLHLLCYTYEDEISAIFYYTKKDGSAKDFEFSCLEKLKTEQSVSPYFHTESGSIYISWVNENRFTQYVLNKDQKNWNKKLDSIIASGYSLQLVEYYRNRKGKALIAKKTYFVIDNKYNISLPYFKSYTSENAEQSLHQLPQNTDGDLIRYIPYILDEVRSLAQISKSINERLEKLENKNKLHADQKTNADNILHSPNSGIEENTVVNNKVKLKKSSFKDQFMSTNKLLSRPEATALYVGSAEIPKPDELSKKEGFELVENEPEKLEQPEAIQVNPPKQEIEATGQKEANLFKKIGDFFK